MRNSPQFARLNQIFSAAPNFLISSQQIAATAQQLQLKAS